MPPDLSGLGTGIAIILSPIYTIGYGQVFAIPGTLISGLTSSIFAIKELFFHIKMKRTSDTNSKITYEHKKFEAKNHALNSAAATTFLALGWIPIIGGALGIISGERILKHKKVIHWKQS